MRERSGFRHEKGGMRLRKRKEQKEKKRKKNENLNQKFDKNTKRIDE